MINNLIMHCNKSEDNNSQINLFKMKVIFVKLSNWTFDFS